MKKNVIVFGMISGVIVASFMAFSMSRCYANPINYDHGMLIGYASMVIAFSFVFIGIKNQRDKYNNGFISFGEAFKVGFFISLIASTIYVAVWAIEYNVFMPDFMEKYTEYKVNHAKTSGASQVEIDKELAEMASVKELYKNPLLFVLFTYLEILPVGLVIALISAAILKRKPKDSNATVIV